MTTLKKNHTIYIINLIPAAIQLELCLKTQMKIFIWSVILIICITYLGRKIQQGTTDAASITLKIQVLVRVINCFPTPHIMDQWPVWICRYFLKGCASHSYEAWWFDHKGLQSNIKRHLSKIEKYTLKGISSINYALGILSLSCIRRKKNINMSPLDCE